MPAPFQACFAIPFLRFSVQIRADHCLSTAFLMIASPRRSFSWLCFAVPSLLIAKLISGVLCLRTALSIFANLIPCFSARLSPAPPYAIQFQCCVLPSKAPLREAVLRIALHVHSNSLLRTAFHPQIISASCLSRPLQIASLLIGAVPVHLCATSSISYHPQFASDPCSSKPLQFVFVLIGAVLYLCISHFHAGLSFRHAPQNAAFLCLCFVSLRFSAFPLRFTGLLCSRLLRCAPAQSAAHPPSGTGRSSPPPWATR